MSKTFAQIINKNPLQLFINRKAEIKIDIYSKDVYEVTFSGVFSDVIGASFDIINSIVEKGELPYYLVKELLTMSYDEIYHLFEKANKEIEETHISFKIDKKKTLSVFWMAMWYAMFTA